VGEKPSRRLDRWPAPRRRPTAVGNRRVPTDGSTVDSSRLHQARPQTLFADEPVSLTDLGAFMQRLTVTRSARWKQHKKEVGVGHLYQGRYKSFPIESDNHFIQVVRYVERNALRANLVREAENWEWSSLWIQQFGSAEHRRLLSP
jgi:hypothetical protein